MKILSAGKIINVLSNIWPKIKMDTYIFIFHITYKYQYFTIFVIFSDMANINYWCDEYTKEVGTLSTLIAQVRSTPPAGQNAALRNCDDKISRIRYALFVQI